MLTKSLVCQLVETQVVRYLAGDALSDEALRQLDAHIAACHDCQAFLEAKKAELTNALQPNRAKDPKEKVLQAIVDARRVNETPLPSNPPTVKPSPGASPATGGKSLQWKPLLLSVALALVLVAMSALTSNPSAVFGRKASEALAANKAPTLPTAEKSAAPIAQPDPEATAGALDVPVPNPGDPEFIGPAAPAPGEVEANHAESEPITDPEPSTTPTPAVAAPKHAGPKVAVRTRARTRAVRPRPAPRPAAGPPTIRVYDANGKPL